jgi:hypothetical protein
VLIVKRIAVLSEQRSFRLVVRLCKLLGILDINMSRVSDVFLGGVGQYVGDGGECTLKL